MILQDYKLFQCYKGSFNSKSYAKALAKINTLEKNFLNLDPFEMELDMLLSLKRAIVYLKDKTEGRKPDFKKYPNSLSKIWNIKACVKILKKYPSINNDQLIKNRIKTVWYYKTMRQLDLNTPKLSPRFVDELFINKPQTLISKLIVNEVNSEFFLLSTRDEIIGLAHKDEIRMRIKYNWLAHYSNNSTGGKMYKASMDNVNKFRIKMTKRGVLEIIKNS